MPSNFGSVEQNLQINISLSKTMRNEEIVQYEDLLEMSGTSSPAALAAWLATHEVRSFKGRGGRPVTTRLALNSALGLVGGELPRNSKPLVQVG